MYFGLGAVVGASVESTGNIKNLCAADITQIIVSGYHIYYYMMDYMESQEELALAWSITYMVKAFETWYNIECEVLQEWKDGLTSNITASISGDSEEPETQSSRPKVLNHDESYNNKEEPGEQNMPWFDQNEDGE